MYLMKFNKNLCLISSLIFKIVLSFDLLKNNSIIIRFIKLADNTIDLLLMHNFC